MNWVEFGATKRLQNDFENWIADFNNVDIRFYVAKTGGRYLVAEYDHGLSDSPLEPVPCRDGQAYHYKVKESFECTKHYAVPYIVSMFSLTTKDEKTVVDAETVLDGIQLEQLMDGIPYDGFVQVAMDEVNHVQSECDLYLRELIFVRMINTDEPVVNRQMGDLVARYLLDRFTQSS